MRKIILDANVLSRLADDKTGRQFLHQKDFYSQEANGCIWHVTQEIIDELEDMLSREGKRELHANCFELLKYENAVLLPPVDLSAVLQRTDVRQALKDHNKKRSDRRDKRNIARAVKEGFPFLCHDKLLCQRAKKINDLELVSWHLRPQKGQSTVKRDRGGNRIDW